MEGITKKTMKPAEELEKEIYDWIVKARILATTVPQSTREIMVLVKQFRKEGMEEAYNEGYCYGQNEYSGLTETKFNEWYEENEEWYNQNKEA